MYNWYLPTISELIRNDEPEQSLQTKSLAQYQVMAERDWCGAIAALNLLLQQMVEADQTTAPGNACALTRGLVISGALPVLTLPEAVASFSTWTLTAMPLQATAWMPFHLLPSTEHHHAVREFAASTLPLLPDDPLASEQFCLVLTTDFSLVMALGETTSQQPQFMFSFDPDQVWQTWRALRSRLLLTSPSALTTLDPLIDQFAPVVPDYRTVTQFSRLMLAHRPEPSDWDIEHESRHAGNGWRHHGTERVPTSHPDLEDSLSQFADSDDPVEPFTQEPAHQADVELLKAIAHEVRTPLTTIRTLTRLLLKRKDLNPDVIKRLEVIDQECTEQIDRFGLIFRAVELQTSTAKQPFVPPSAISLTQVFQQNIPRWQQQANQRNLTLDVALPSKLPMVLADSSMLDQMLTGVIDRITHSLPPGSHIKLRVTLAGHQLKLQFQPHPHASNGHTSEFTPVFKPALKSLGELLMFQPDTGSLSLNLAVTKNLFQALGGKLIVRNRRQQGEELTVFLPLETTRSED